MPASGGFTFGPFLLDPGTRRLLCDAVEVRLTDRDFDVLHELVARAGDVVSKDRLIAVGWPDSVGSDNSLAQSIVRVRAALKEHAPQAGRAVVVTVPWRGYRLGVPVERRDASLTAAQVDALFAPHRAWTEGLAALETLGRAELDRAQAAFERLAAHDPANASYRVGLANAYALKFEATRADREPDTASIGKALTHALEARRVNPDYAEAHATLGFVLERTGDRLGALAALRQAVRLQPDNWRHRFRLAYGSWGQERVDAARAALKYFPEFPLARVLVATVWVARGMLDEAEREIDLGIAALPATTGAPARFSTVALFYLKGQLCLARGDADAAIAAYERELALEPRGHLYARECAANTWCAIGAVRLQRGQRDRARAAFEEAIARVERHPMARAGLAILDATPVPDAALVTRSVAEAMAWAAVLVAAGAVDRAVALVLTALESAPPTSGGWTLPIDPMLGVGRNPHAWRDVLVLLRTRAG